MAIMNFAKNSQIIMYLLVSINCLQLTFERVPLTLAHDQQLKYCAVELAEKGIVEACQKKLDLHTHTQVNTPQNTQI